MFYFGGDFCICVGGGAAAAVGDSVGLPGEPGGDRTERGGELGMPEGVAEPVGGVPGGGVDGDQPVCSLVYASP